VLPQLHHLSVEVSWAGGSGSCAGSGGAGGGGGCAGGGGGGTGCCWEVGADSSPNAGVVWLEWASSGGAAAAAAGVAAVCALPEEAARGSAVLRLPLPRGFVEAHGGTALFAFPSGHTYTAGPLVEGGPIPAADSPAAGSRAAGAGGAARCAWAAAVQQPGGGARGAGGGGAAEEALGFLGSHS
jgi:hypothetical protein